MISIKKIILGLLFIIGLIYVVLPAPSSIDDFSGLPNSLKSTEPGDTVQNPNIAAYFSDYRRSFVTNYYRNQIQNLNCCKDGSTVFSELFSFIPPIRLNHRPESAFQYIRDQQRGTYLEEYLYPLRGSIFVNGYEPFDENGKPFNSVSTSIIVGDQIFETKTTLRYYPANVFWRIFVYIGIWVMAIALVKVFLRVRRES